MVKWHFHKKESSLSGDSTLLSVRRLFKDSPSLLSSAPSTVCLHKTEIGNCEFVFSGVVAVRF